MLGPLLKTRIVDKKEIEHSFNQGRFSAALDGLNTLSPSAWRDTTQLRCLRSMGKHKKALALANTLHKQMGNGSPPYQTTRSERNHQHRYIALVFSEMGKATEACEIMQSLVEQSPNLPALRREYAYALNSDGRLDLAEKELQHALLLQPENANAHAQLARIYCRTARVQAGYDAYARASTLGPDNADYLQRLVHWSNYLPSTTQQSNYHLSRLWATKAYPTDKAANNIHRTPDPQRRLKLGLVSSDLCAHAHSFFIKPLLRGLNKQQFETIAYSTAAKEDAVTEQFKELSDDWRSCAKLSDRDLAALIRQDEIDVLLDLNGHTVGNRLGVFVDQCAPLQASWLGYPATTGLQSIGLRITDRIADPVGSNEQFSSEKLIRLPNGLLCFEPLNTSPDATPKPNDGPLRFGSFCSLAKITNLTLDSWAAALRAVPGSTLYIKRRRLTNEGTRSILFNEFKKRGIDSNRVTLQTSTATIEEHLDEYNKVDIALDTTPYNSTTTTLEALWMGVPVITLAGNLHASRISTSILHRLDLNHLSTSSVQEFGECAKALAADPEALAKLKTGLRARLQQSPILDATKFGRDFGAALRSEWQEWCQQQSTTSNQKRTKNPAEEAI